MAFTIAKGYTFGTTELVTNVKLHTLVDSPAGSCVIACCDANNTAVDIDFVHVLAFGA